MRATVFQLDAPEGVAQHGLLAFRVTNQLIEVDVCQSAAGYYIGTRDPHDGSPLSRESIEYFSRRHDAEMALATRTWTQRLHF